MNIVMTGKGKFIEVQGTAEGKPFTATQLEAMTALATEGIGTLVTLQLMRESKARRRSLVAFTAKVAQIVPGTQSLSADPSIRASDRMVLAYRLRRPILREDGVAAERPYLVPAAARLGKWCAGATLLAESGDGANDFALLRAAAPGATRRVSPLCGGDPPPAGPTSRLLLPFGDPASGPSPAPAP